MKTCNRFFLFFLMVAVATTAFCQDAEPAAASEKAPDGSVVTKSNFLKNMETLDNETNRVSYAIGVNIARNIQHSYPQVNIDFFLLALRDVLGGTRPRLNEQQINEGIVKFSEAANRTAKERVTRTSDTNLQDAERFLQVNGQKEGVTTTESGLQYRVIQEGSGLKPNETAEVRFNCTTKLLDGRVIDSTVVDGKRPLVVRLDSTIPAWKEAIPLMNVGSKWEIYAHPKLAYGETGAQNIGPNELLIFRIELMGTTQ